MKLCQNCWQQVREIVLTAQLNKVGKTVEIVQPLICEWWIHDRYYGEVLLAGKPSKDRMHWLERPPSKRKVYELTRHYVLTKDEAEAVSTSLFGMPKRKVIP